MGRRRSSKDSQRARELACRAYRRQGGKCFWCLEPMLFTAPKPFPGEQHPKLMTADHVLPIRWGGRTEPGNIVAACHECNFRRDQDLPKHELKAVVEVLRSPFEVLAVLKPIMEAEAEADAKSEQLRREFRMLAKYGQLP